MPIMRVMNSNFPERMSGQWALGEAGLRLRRRRQLLSSDDREGGKTGWVGPDSAINNITTDN